MNSVEFTQFQMFRMLAYVRFTLAAVVILYLSGICRASTTILDTQGFESYSIAPLQGQSAGAKNWLTVGSGGSTAAVVDSVGVNNSKGVRVVRGSNSSDWWAVSYSGDGLPNYRYVFIDWDMKVNNTGAVGSTRGPFLGVVSYDDTSNPQVLGTLGVDATTRQIMYQSPGSGSLTDTTITVDANWHHYQLRLDFLAHLYSSAVDDVLGTAAPIPFVDGASNTFSDADIAAFAAAANATSQRQTATAFVDNFKVRQVVAGDYNFDGTLDAADYVAWRKGLGTQRSLLAADGNGNGVVDSDDYTLWRSNFGTTFGNAASIGASSSVPEPSSIVSLALIAVIWCNCLRTRAFA